MSPAAGANALKIEVRRTVQEINAKALSFGDRALNIMRNVELEVLGKDGSGRLYKRGKKSFHVASAPGESPSPDTGTLRRNWRQQKLATGGAGSLRIILRMKSGVGYAKYLDPGTRYIAQRPIKKPIEDKSRPQVAALFSNL